MDNIHHDRIGVAEPGQLVAELPRLLGFHPANSLVVVGLGVDGNTTMCMGLRADLPRPEDYVSLAAQLTIPLLSRSITATILIVVGGSDTGHDDELPHRGLLAECEQRFSDVGLGIQHELWTASTAEGACWRCYDDSECAGFVPAARDGVFAAAHVVDGVRVYQCREDIAATLAPAAEDVLARRADLLAARPLSDAHVRSQLALVDAAVRRAVDGVLPTSDQDIVLLTAALTDHWVRDASIRRPDAIQAQAAEQLWATLVREAPAPERAEAASLLAFSAYQRGDGVLTAIALDCAEMADPEHRLSGLLRALLTLALPPERARHAAERATAVGREQIAAEPERRPQ